MGVKGEGSGGKGGGKWVERGRELGTPLSTPSILANCMQLLGLRRTRSICDVCATYLLRCMTNRVNHFTIPRCLLSLSTIYCEIEY